MCWSAALSLVVIAASSVARNRNGVPFIRRFESSCATFARSRWAFLAFGIAILVLSCGFILCLWLPEPGAHDEFSYLLQADTFAHGRLANPTHPMWKHFENFHIIQHPTYASKYPPGQGLFLALGKVLGQPIIGVWLSTALAGSAIFWALAGLFPRAWALAGAVLALANPQVLEWNWCYWGGSVALIGGALAIGGALRNLRNLSKFHSAAIGVGMGILSLSRPFEGFVLALLLTVVCTARFWWQKIGWSAYCGRFVLPLGVLVAPALLFQAYYNFRVTLNPLKMPYSVYEETYSQAPAFLWQSRRGLTPQYNNPQMARLYAEWVDPIFYWQHTARGFWRYFKEKNGMYAPLVWDGLSVVFVVPLMCVLRRNRLCVLILSLVLAAFLVTFTVPVWAWPHYSAPFYPLIVTLLVFALRELRAWHWGNHRWGRWAARCIFVFLLTYSVGEFVGYQKTFQGGWQYGRAALQSSLQKDGMKHLVIVGFGPHHDVHHGWVWNEADIDRAPVVWASDLGDAENQKLLDYFKGYKVTVVLPDEDKVVHVH